MKKIAFIVVRYGAEVNGGAEVHCRMLAERLTSFYQVEVLTTTLKVFGAPELDYPAETTTENGVLIRRFEPAPIDGRRMQHYYRHCRSSRQTRYLLSKAGLLAPFTALNPRWTMGLQAEQRYYKSRMEYTPELFRFIEEHQDEYAAFIPVCYFFATTIFAGLTVPQKTILIPTAHPEKPLFASIYTHLFTQVRHIAFNTEAESRLCRKAFGRRLAEHSIVGAGTDPASPADWLEVKAKYGLPDRYALYLGRVTKGKVLTLIPDFIRYRRSNPDARLVIVGGIDSSVSRPDDPGVVLTGFVSEADKSAIVRHASLMINPSRLESLSLLLLEALENSIPVLVNGRSEVMKDHCRKSGAALWYDNPRDFQRQLHRLFSDDALRRELGAKGPEYVRNNYDWGIIIPKLQRLIENI